MNMRLLQRLWRLRHHNSHMQALYFNAANYGTLTIQHQLFPQRTEMTIHSVSSTTRIQQLATARIQVTRLKNNSTTPAVEDLLQQIESQWKDFGNVRVDRIGLLFSQLEAQPDAFNQLLTEEHTNALLEICGSYIPAVTPTQRQTLFERFWAYLLRNGEIRPIHYVTRLQAMQYNRIELDNAQSFVDEMTKCAGDIVLPDTNFYATLLEATCSVGNMQQATTILEAMRSHNLPLTERNFAALIMGHGRNGDTTGWQSVVSNMQAAAVPQTSQTYAAIALAHVDTGNVEKAIEFIRQYSGQFDVAQLIGMLRSIGIFSKPDSNETTMAQLKELIALLVSELPGDCTCGPELPLALRNVCIELIHVAKIDVLVAVLKALPKPRFSENQDTDTFCAFILRELTYSFIPVTEVIGIAQLLRKSEKNTRALYIAAEKALRRNPPSALPIFAAIEKESLEENVTAHSESGIAITDSPKTFSTVLKPHFFWPLLQYNFRRNGESGLFHTLRSMTGQFGVAIDADTLKQYILPRLELTMEDAAQAIKQLDEVGVKPSTSLNPILSHLILQQKMDEALELLRLYPTKLSVVDLIGPLTHLAVHARATRRFHPYVKLLLALREHSETPRMDLAGQVLVDVLTTQDRFRSDVTSVKKIVTEFERCGLQLSTAAIESIRSLIREQSALPSISPTTTENWEAVMKTLFALRSKELTLAPDGVVPAVLASRLAGSAPSDSSIASSFIKHPRDMTIEELECHLVELEAKKLNTRGVLRRLLQLCVRDDKLQRALEIKAKCDAMKINSSPGMMASIFDLYIKSKNLPEAKKAKKKLSETFPGFNIDEHKIVDFATLLIESGSDLNGALEILTQRANTSRIQGGNYVLKNVWHLLNATAQHAAKKYSKEEIEPNLTKSVFHTLNKLGYCRPQNAILGPIVREWLLRDNIEAAVMEFCLLAKEYRHTPLQFELLSLLVRHSNRTETEQIESSEKTKNDITPEIAQRLLTDLTDAISKVHGALNMNSALLLAFAESGTDSHLRRLLIDPKFRINQDMLIRNCEHLSRSGAVATLLRLGRCARGVGHVVDEKQIYTMLLDQFVNANECDAALELFERLEADDELKISQDFLRSLVKLLRMNNREIPSQIALQAQVV